jgi:hypothetical protein
LIAGTHWAVRQGKHEVESLDGSDDPFQHRHGDAEPTMADRRTDLHTSLLRVRIDSWRDDVKIKLYWMSYCTVTV